MQSQQHLNVFEGRINTSTETDLNGDYSFVGLPVADFYRVSLNAPFANLILTTTAASSIGLFNHPATEVVVTSDGQGYTTGAYADVPVDTNITNMDFAFRSAVDYDFGDLPNSYLTLLTNNGPRHIIPATPNLYLGGGVSTEPDGQPSFGADADFFDDGVFVTGIWQNGIGGGKVEVDVVGSGWLVGFIDFSVIGVDDPSVIGNFLGVGDMVINEAVTTGTHTINFDIPPGSIAVEGTTSFYSRFRLFPEQPNNPVVAFQGEASNGEVEDYLWTFQSIGDFVWLDANGNGIQDPGEPGLAGVVVNLLNSSNVAVLDINNQPITTITDADGFYSFTGLPVGTYRVEFELPAGYVFSP